MSFRSNREISQKRENVLTFTEIISSLRPSLLKLQRGWGMSTRNSKSKLTGYLLILMALAPLWVLGQGVDSAFVRVNVTDPSGGTVPGATVTMTNDGTGVEATCMTDETGSCRFASLMPATYTGKVAAANFKTAVREKVVLYVGQQIDLNFTLEIGLATASVTVQSGAPLINTVSPDLGTTVTGNYILDMPLFDRNPTNLIFLAPGVTNVNGGNVNALGGLNFTSNGQRTFTAELRLDGAVASAPEGGEGGTNNVTYKPSVEGIQEFKLITNGYSAEYGSNGGTVISMITKSGTNEYHGSGYYFSRRPWMDANGWFANAAEEPKASYKWEQYGGSIGGPILKKKLFFFFDIEKDQFDQPFSVGAIVPTALERTGNFSQSFNPDGSPVEIYDPAGALVDGARPQFHALVNGVDTLNVIPADRLDPLGMALINLLPAPNQTVDPSTGDSNYVANLATTVPGWQLDGKVDYYLTESNTLTGRYYMRRETQNVPDPFLSANVTQANTYGFTLSDNWTVTPSWLWSNRVTLTRFNTPEYVKMTVDPLNINGSGVGFPQELVNNPFYTEPAFPSISFDSGYQGLNVDACCTVTRETDTQWSYNSIATKNAGRHTFKFGGERRVYLNNFFQPSNTAGGFAFNQNVTAQDVLGGSGANDIEDGNDLASMLINYPYNQDVLTEVPAVANKSMETSFFFQDDWRVTPKLTLNLGLRYEFSTPYTERFNRDQFTCFTCDSGINVPAQGDYPGGELLGTSILATPSHRHSNTDWNNVGPRLGFAYALNDSTVIRGGFGVYYGLNFATNWQYGGAAWNGAVPFFSSEDGGFTQVASMNNPFPNGFSFPQEGKYGELTLYGLENFNHAGLSARNAELYQWNIGVQHQFWKTFMIEVNYSANRSTHLPYDKTLRSQNYLSAANRTGCDPGDPSICGTQYLNQQVPNPFQYLFVQMPGQPAPLFNEPTSQYNNPEIPRLLTLLPHPQFPALYGYTPFAASATYNALQVRFEKRYSNGLSFTGNYTYAHQLASSDEGANSTLGSRLGAFGPVQDKNNLAAEWSISANDTPQRFVIATTYELPFGRGKPFGKDANQFVDALIGGWQVGAFITYQSGQPLPIRVANNHLSGGSQRPNMIGDPCTGLSIHDVLNGKGPYLNPEAFEGPGDQMAGNTPRYISSCRTDSIRNLDMNVSKTFKIHENITLQLRGEFFNAFNHPNFGAPNTRISCGSIDDLSCSAGSFGQFQDSQPDNQWRHGQLGIRLMF